MCPGTEALNDITMAMLRFLLVPADVLEAGSTEALNPRPKTQGPEPNIGAAIIYYFGVPKPYLF